MRKLQQKRLKASTDCGTSLVVQWLRLSNSNADGAGSTTGWENKIPHGTQWASQVALVVRNLPANAGDIRDMSSIPGLERSPEGRHGNLLQYSCLENPHGQRSLAGYSPFSHKAEYNWSDLACMHAWIYNVYASNHRQLLKLIYYTQVWIKERRNSSESLW